MKKIQSEMSSTRMKVLLDTAKSLNSKQDTAAILNSLLDACLKIIPGGNIGAILLHNKETNCLDMKAYNGMSDAVKTVSLKLEESISGYSFRTRETLFLKNKAEVDAYMSTMAVDNLEKAIDGGAGPSEINSSICCPLLFDETPIGVLVIDNTNPAVPLVYEDIEFLEDISVQAAVAINNAQSLENEKRNHQLLKAYTELIEHERNNFEYSLELHDKFTDMVFQGSKIQDIIEEAHRIVDKDIFLINDLFSIEASTIKSKEDLNHLQNFINQNITTLNQKKRTYIASSDTTPAFFVFPILKHHDIYALLCVISNDQKISKLNTIAIERATTIIAMDILKSHELFSVEQSIRGDFIDTLLRNPMDSYIKTLRKKYNLKKKGHFITVLMQFEFPDTSKMNAIEQRPIIRRHMSNYYRLMTSILNKKAIKHFASIKGSTLVIIIDQLLEDYQLPISESLKQFDEEYLFHSQYFSETVAYRSAISQVYDNLNDFKVSYNNTKELLKIMAGYNKNDSYMFYDGLNVHQFLWKSSKEELSSYYETLFKPLNSYSGQSKEDFFETLTIYIQSNCNWTYTKNTLHIHGNTLSYRLNRIRDLLNLDFDNYQDRLKLQIGLEIKRMLG